jgi:transcriptional regulator GlxA family with amidase domain
VAVDTSERAVVVTAVVADRMVGSFGLGVAAEIFGYDRRAMGLPRFDFALAAVEPGTVRTDIGVALVVEHGLARIASSDVVLVTSWEDLEHPCPPALLDALRAAHRRGAQLVSHCSGAFVLARAGLLDGRRATTHWRLAGELAARYPEVEVDPAVLYVDSGRVITGAGTASGIDAMLHLVRREWGAAAANALAREMVVPPHRDGGQAQYIRRPVPEPQISSTGKARGWALKHLHRPVTLRELAAQESMSVRTFTRRFREEVGVSPVQWLTQQRIERARQLLEETDLSIDRIAADAGFGTAASLRQHLQTALGVSPSAYRNTFRSPVRV